MEDPNCIMPELASPRRLIGRLSLRRGPFRRARALTPYHRARLPVAVVVAFTALLLRPPVVKVVLEERVPAFAFRSPQFLHGNTAVPAFPARGGFPLGGRVNRIVRSRSPHRAFYSLFPRPGRLSVSFFWVACRKSRIEFLSLRLGFGASRGEVVWGSECEVD